jgi:carbamoyl-phosphate synthase large subunit
MEHIELAGVHSGDSACIIPSVHISEENIATIKEYTKKIAEEMHVKGLMNMQYAIENGKVYVLEANPRASRTVPLVSKVCNIRMVPIATDIITSEITGRPSPIPELKEQCIPNYGVKEAAFPFNMFPEVDPILGPEMRSTGEVLGMSPSYGEAFFKAQEAVQSKLPLEGTVLISVNNKDKDEVIAVARSFAQDGFRILATEGTYKTITSVGIPAKQVKKLKEGRPNVYDLITNGDVQLVINSPKDKDGMNDDSYLRKAAIKAKVPYMTTLAAAIATAEGIHYVKNHEAGEIKSLQAMHEEIHDK